MLESEKKTSLNSKQVEKMRNLDNVYICGAIFKIQTYFFVVKISFQTSLILKRLARLIVLICADKSTYKLV